jgi:hypothetical protein
MFLSSTQSRPFLLAVQYWQCRRSSRPSVPVGLRLFGTNGSIALQKAVDGGQTEWKMHRLSVPRGCCKRLLVGVASLLLVARQYTVRASGKSEAIASFVRRLATGAANSLVLGFRASTSFRVLGFLARIPQTSTDYQAVAQIPYAASPQ